MSELTPAPAATFSAGWLALREVADHRARAAALEAELAARLSPLAEQRIVDLGAGSGSNLRALAPKLGPRQHWILVDHDDTLAEAARTAFRAFADGWREDGGTLVLDLAGKEVTVEFALRDIAADPAAPLAFRPHLVTASAFYDLVSADWCRRFAAAFAGSGVVLHAALTCDGRDAWSPPHPADAEIADAFRAHQGTDKGFGPATGADAATILGEALEAAGYAIETANSPWRLDAGDRQLIAELAKGTAQAAVESGRVPAAVAADWHQARAMAQGCVIGHVDLLAMPRG
ncbi:SAM-dependent methyltransferase [Xanthobacter sp. YC-JY1]|uniref:SAM-dependent methyltransferase n=1 Tax=Xanthobacter sp. YC-JY1 TaxID=2419844 RepID=UPI001F3D8523|nr:SAM-dependent methyltransferase [Xanthobacter sp. YC-JY1]UJX46924.1 SAM-dependent methyltransferase [Xanthobacter sp. YC-JY1]